MAASDRVTAAAGMAIATSAINPPCPVCDAVDACEHSSPGSDARFATAFGHLLGAAMYAVAELRRADEHEALAPRSKVKVRRQAAWECRRRAVDQLARAHDYVIGKGPR